MPSSYDLQIGRIWVPTLQGDYGLSLGNGLEAVGSLVFGGEARPRDLKLTLPVHGEWEDADPRAIANRLRRQLEALLENEAARLPGVYLRWLPFPDRDAWVAIGSAELVDAEGGPTAGNYTLELSDLKRVGTDTTIRPARRIRRADRRLTTVARDAEGTLFSSDFAAAPAIAAHVLPAGAVDLIGARSAPITPPGVRRGLGGSLPVLIDRPVDELVSFEQAAIAAGAGGGDVVIYDRRGKTADAGARAGLAGPNLTDFAGTDGKGGGVAAALDFSASNAGTPIETLVRGRQREDGTWVLYYRVERAPAASPLLRDLLGAAGTPVTPGGVVGVRIRTRELVGGGTRRALIYWHKADGTPSATAVTVAATGTDDVGAGNVAVPADAAFASLAASPLNTVTVWEVEVEAWAIVPGATSTPDFLSGDQRGRRWLGDPGVSFSALEPQAANGWEEVFGSTQRLTAGDVPVLENGLCRLRWGTVGGVPGFYFDVWSSTSSTYVERGRFIFWQDWPASTRATFNELLRANVVSWTPERVVLCVHLNRAGAGRARLYVTLQRGWLGPRFELYGSRYDGNVPGNVVQFAPAGAANDRTAVARLESAAALGALKVEPEQTFANATVGDFAAASAAGQPGGLIVAPAVAGAPPILLSVLQAAPVALLRNDTTPYGDARNGVSIDGRAAGAAARYLSVKVDALLGGQHVDSTAIRSSGGTITQVADAAASSGQATQDAQAAPTAFTLRIAGLGRGVYGTWVRARVVDAGATGSFRAVAAATGATVTTTSTAYVWLYLGESTIDLVGGGNEIRVFGWRSAGTGVVRFDRVACVPLERRDPLAPGYDGARDLAAQALVDSRQDLALVSR